MGNSKDLPYLVVQRSLKGLQKLEFRMRQAIVHPWHRGSVVCDKHYSVV